MQCLQSLQTYETSIFLNFEIQSRVQIFKPFIFKENLQFLTCTILNKKESCLKL